jgi:hypothetical protein
MVESSYIRLTFRCFFGSMGNKRVTPASSCFGCVTPSLESCISDHSAKDLEESCGPQDGSPNAENCCRNRPFFGSSGFVGPSASEKEAKSRRCPSVFGTEIEVFASGWTSPKGILIKIPVGE